MNEPPFVAPRSKPELKELISTHRNMFSVLLDDLSDEEVVRVPGPQKDRSLKDLLAHLVWWEDYMMSRVLLAKSGIASIPQQEPDQLNELVYTMHKDLPLQVVRDIFNLSVHRLFGFIDCLSWDEIEGGLSVAGEPIGYLIAGNTFGHYDEHYGAVARYVKTLQ